MSAVARMAVGAVAAVAAATVGVWLILTWAEYIVAQGSPYF